MDSLYNLTLTTFTEVWTSFTHNWPFLVVSVLVAAALKLYADPEKVSAFLIRHKKAGILGATAAAVGTPLCSCGTTAVVLGMMASLIPWAPIVAFMVASPLTSPEELIYSAGLFGWPFALTYFLSSILLGLAGGGLAAFFEGRGWLQNQTRMPGIKDSAGAVSKNAEVTSSHSYSINTILEVELQPAPACACNPGTTSSPARVSIPSPARMEEDCSCSQPEQPTKSMRVSIQDFIKEVLDTGKRLLAMFLGFAFIGYFLNGLIPNEWVRTLFGSSNSLSIPLAATLGLPLYINSEASLPLIRSLIEGGMSQGAAMAFLITGAGTSIGAITGALTIARWRVIALVIFTLWFGAIITGYCFSLFSAAG